MTEETPVASANNKLLTARWLGEAAYYKLTFKMIEALSNKLI